MQEPEFVGTAAVLQLETSVTNVSTGTRVTQGSETVSETIHLVAVIPGVPSDPTVLTVATAFARGTLRVPAALYVVQEPFPSSKIILKVVSSATALDLLLTAPMPIYIDYRSLCN